MTARDLASRQVGDVNRRIRRDLNDLSKRYKDVDVEVSRLDKDTDRYAGTTRRASRDIDRHARSIDQLGQRIRNLNSALPGLNAGMGVFIAAFAPGLIGAIGQVVGLVGQLAAGAGALGAALAPLGGGFAALLPAVTGIGAAMAVWKLSMKDLTDAMSGNAAALKRLTPEARSFLRELKPLREEFKALKQEVQANLFQGLSEGMRQANLPALLRVLRTGLSDTAQTMGEMATQFGNFLGQSRTRGDFARVFKDVQPLLRQLVPVVENLASAFFSVEHAAQPLALWMGRVVEQVSRNVEVWAKAGEASGRLGSFFNRTRDTMTILGRTTMAFGRSLANIFREAYPLGHALLIDLQNSAQNFERWTRSLRGRAALADYFRNAAGPIKETVRLVRDVGKAIFEIGAQPGVAELVRILRTQLLPALQDALINFAKFGPGLAVALSDLVRLIADLAGPAGGLAAFTTALDKVIRGLDWLVKNVPAVSGVLKGVVIAFGAFAAIRMLGLITGLTRVLFLVRQVNQAGGIGGALGGWVGRGTRNAAQVTTALEAQGAVLGARQQRVMTPQGPMIVGLPGRAAIGSTVVARPPTLLQRFGGMSRLARGASVGGLAAGIAASAAPSFIPGRTGQVIGNVGGLALAGAAAGSLVAPGLGTAVGAVVGGLAGLAVSFRHSTPHIDSFARNLDLAARAAHNARNALDAIKSTQRDRPFLRAQVTEAQIGVRGALAERRGVEATLTAATAKRQGIDLRSATPAQRAEIEKTVKSTDAWKQANDNVVFSYRTLSDSITALKQNEATHRNAVRLNEQALANYQKQIANVTANFRNQVAETRKSTAAINDQQLLMHGWITQQEANRRQQARANKVLDDYTEKMGKFAAVARAQGKPAMADLADTAQGLALQLHKIPTLREIKIAIEIERRGVKDLDDLTAKIHDLRAQGRGGEAVRVATIAHRTGADILPGRARGGRIPGMPVAADTVQAMLSPGEFVVTGHGEQLLEAITGIPNLLDLIEQVQRPHFAVGGRVNTDLGKMRTDLLGVPNLTENVTARKGFLDFFRNLLGRVSGGGEVNTHGLTAQVLRALKWARGHGWRGSVTSGFRSFQEQAALYQRYLHGGNIAAQPGRSSHEFGQAVDVSDVAGFARAMSSAPASARLYSRVAGDPVHFSVSGFAAGGRVTGLAPDALLAGISTGQDRLNNPNTILGQILGLPIFSLPERARPASGVPRRMSLRGGTPKQNRQLAQQMAAEAGWKGGEWEALLNLWTGESGFSTTAKNKRSGAYGIPQALPASKLAAAGGDWRTNPATQIRWGLAYIRQRYGSPANAYSKWASRSPHWYRHGGRVGRALRFVAGGRVGDAAEAGTRTGALLDVIGAPGGSASIVTRARDAVRRLAAQAANASIGQLNSMAKQIETEIRRLTAAGAGKTQAGRLGVQRLRAALSVVDNNVGQWIGERLKQVQTIGTVAANLVTRRQQGRRRQGIDDSSVEGIVSSIGDLEIQRDAAKAEMVQLQRAMREAVKRRDPRAAQEIQTQMDELGASIQETTTQIIEAQRAAVQAAAQHAVTMAQHGVAMAQGGMNLQDAISNLAVYIGTAAANAAAAALGIDPASFAAGVSGSPEALRARAAQITSNLLPSLKRQLAALQNQLGIQGAASGAEVMPRPGGTPWLLGEGGYKEFVITTDPKQRRRMLQFVAKFLKSTKRGQAVPLDSDDPALGQILPGVSYNPRSGLPGGVMPSWFNPEPSPPPTPQGTTTVQESAASIQEQIQQTQQQIIDAMAEAAQLLRQAAEMAAQKLIDAADHGTRMAQAQAQNLELQQSLAGAAGTKAGIETRASLMSGTLLPAIQNQVQQIANAAEVARQQGDQDLVDSLSEALSSAQNEALQVQIQIRDLLEQAAAVAVQDAQHGETMTNLAFQRLQIQERLNSTFDTPGGGQERANFILSQVIPALNAEIVALQQQQQVATQQGDPQLATQIAEAIYSKQNDVMQAQLDAQLETASNTDSLIKRLGGSLGFEFGGQSWTDTFAGA